MLRLLIVEDELDLQELVIECFQPDYEVVAVGTLAQAGLKLAWERFDVVLLDVTLPDGNGFDFGSALLADSLNAFPIVFMTGHSEIQRLLQRLPAERVACVIKPYSIAALREQVSKFCRSRNSDAA